MKIKIILKGSLKKYLNGAQERIIEAPDCCTAEEVLKTIGLDWKETHNFGFVAINGKRVMISEHLKEGDELKAYPKISGG